jgi:hypothetical protein
VITAQEGGGEGPIEPAATNTPIPTLTPRPTQQPPTNTPAPTQVSATPMDTPTQVPLATATATLFVPTAFPTFDGPVPTLVPTVPRGVVGFESVFLREIPSPDAPAVASVFRDDPLEIIGRNADGTWFEVARPGRGAAGWVFGELLDTDVQPEFLPITDTTTGVTGPVPIPEDAQFGVFIVEGVALRTLPDRQRGERILNIPPSVTVPVVARYRDGAWLKVNYLGTEGWIIGFVIRERDGILDLPEETGLLPGDDGPAISVRVIPPEVQLEKLQEIRTFTESRLVVATDLANFWFLVQQGEVLPCNPPPTVDAYRYGGEDVQILPEIDRYAPRLNEGVDFLNESVDVLSRCGVVDPNDVNAARNDAINARIIMENTLIQLDNLEEIIE